FTMVRAAAATTGVPSGAGISIASWTRPSARASENVSRNRSGCTPATGTIKGGGASEIAGDACLVADGMLAAGEGNAGDAAELFSDDRSEEFAEVTLPGGSFLDQMIVCRLPTRETRSSRATNK